MPTHRGKPPLVDAAHAIDHELAHHVDELTDRLIAQGLDPTAARATALGKFGDLASVKSELRSIESGIAAGERFWAVVRDARHTFRQFRRSPGFTIAAVLTLALGIGASTAMFGVVKAVVLDPLPYADPHELVELFELTPDGDPFSVADANFLDYRDRVTSFEHLAASSRADLAVTQGERPLNVVANQVTPSYFEVFGAEAELGRTFTADEGGADPAPVAVLSHALRANLFGEEDPLNEVLLLDGNAFTVVGVMPAGWTGLTAPDLWVPLPVASTQDRSDHTLQVVGRLANHSTLDRAKAEAVEVARTLGTEHPETNGDWSVDLVDLKVSLVGEGRIRGGWILLGAVGLLLALACGSVANLLVARASARTREMRVRMALGAGRGRLAQQLIVESLTLALVAAVIGVLFAYVGIPGIRALSPSDAPRIDQAVVSWPVITFAITVALATGVMFGLLPIFGASGSGASQSGHRTAGDAGEGLRRYLVAGQVATTVTLLCGVGLLGSSFMRLQDKDVGLDVSSTTAVPLMMSGDRYTAATRQIAVTEIRAALEQLPGIVSAGSTNIRPFSGSSTAIDLTVEGAPTTAEDVEFVRWRLAGPGFFATAGLPALEGRLFETLDYEDDAEAAVIVTESLAKSFFGDTRSAVGRRIAMGWNGTNWRRIVGVVADVEDLRVASGPPRTFFMPDAGGWPWVTFLVRSRDPLTPRMAGVIREAIWSVAPNQPIPAVEPLSASRSASVAGPRFNLALMTLFGGLALVLSIMGVYGVTLFAVSRRTREIGVRMALGARPATVLAMLLRQGAKLAGIGVAIGIVLAMVLSRFLETLLFETEPQDPVIVATAAAVTLVGVLAATLVPALKATRIDPGAALSAE